MGYHAGASTFSSLVGDGSPHSFASTDWTVGDYFQFELATTGLQGIHISFDQASVTGGPGLFQLQYSTDGNNFTNFGSPYTVLAASAAAGTEAWSSTIYYSEFHSSIDLSSVTALNNAATVYFRLEDSSTTEAFGGGSVNPSATDRVDNLTISAIPVPEPSGIVAILNLVAMCVLACVWKWWKFVA